MVDKNSGPSVAIIILNWNGKRDTLECIASLKRSDYLNYEIIVVDNGSVDDSVAVISEEFPEIVLLETGENLGYAGGNNIGIRWAITHGSDYILILNNDTIVDAQLLSEFFAASARCPDGSILGAKIYFYDKPDTIWFAGGQWDNKNKFFLHIGWGKTDSDEFNNVTQIDYVTGCALFAASTTFQEVGLLDEDFFLTYEETDWCYRAKRKGYACYIIPSAKVWHKVSSSFGGRTSPLIKYFMTRNILLWARKHLPFNAKVRVHLNNIVSLFNCMMPDYFAFDKKIPWYKSLYWSVSHWGKQYGTNRLLFKAIFYGLLDYYLMRYGNCSDKIRYSLCNNVNK